MSVIQLYDQIASYGTNFNYKKYVRKPLRDDLEKIEEEKKGEEDEPKAPYHDWYTQDIKKLPDGKDRNKDAKTAVEVLTKVMDKYEVSIGEKNFAEINEEEEEEEEEKEREKKYKNTSYFKHFDKCPRYIYLDVILFLIYY